MQATLRVPTLQGHAGMLQGADLAAQCVDEERAEGVRGIHGAAFAPSTATTALVIRGLRDVTQAGLDRGP